MTRRAVQPLAAAAVVALALAGAVAGASAGALRAAPICENVTVGGATVVVHCGPAKATFTFGGKTYRVFGGKCVVESSLGLTAWSVNVGRQALPPAKPKFPEFHATFIGKPKAGTFTKGQYVVDFAVPGKGWTLVPGLPHKVRVVAGAKSGTFSGRFYTGSQTATKPASGAWTC